ncbi:MAG: methyltransferase domain-containing protein [Opitutae bacterium]|nr:methyltransferase domain-containing protein [Opitutae bacterium]
MSDPADPKFWDERYANGKTPWDYGGVPPQLRDYLAAHPRGGRALVPGCGSGHEISALHRAGYDVTAIDFAPAAAECARRNLGAPLAERVVLGDFFTYDFPGAPFDVIYERTFLCALPLDLREKYAARTAQLLKPGGALVGLFYLGDDLDGPPFALSAADEARLFPPRLLLVNDQPVAEKFPLFGDAERWREYRRVN